MYMESGCYDAGLNLRNHQERITVPHSTLQTFLMSINTFESSHQIKVLSQFMNVYCAITLKVQST